MDLKNIIKLVMLLLEILKMQGEYERLTISIRIKNKSIKRRINKSVFIYLLKFVKKSVEKIFPNYFLHANNIVHTLYYLLTKYHALISGINPVLHKNKKANKNMHASMVFISFQIVKSGILSAPTCKHKTNLPKTIQFTPLSHICSPNAKRRRVPSNTLKCTAARINESNIKQFYEHLTPKNKKINKKIIPTRSNTAEG